MNPIELFLGAISKKIESLQNAPSDFESKKNDKLEIDNILLKYGKRLESLTYKELLSFSDDDKRRIIELYCHFNDRIPASTKIDQLFSDVAIINIFEQTAKDSNANFNPPQYTDSVNELKRFVKNVQEDIPKFLNENASLIEENKKNIKKLETYRNMFANGELVKPIINLQELYKLLDELNITSLNQAKILKHVGQKNTKLINPLELFKPKTDERIVKYKTILESKMTKYGEICKKIGDYPIDFFHEDKREEDINKLTDLLNISYEDIKQSVVCLMLKKDIDEFDLELDKNIIDDEVLNYLLSEMEGTVKYSREKVQPNDEPKELTEAEKTINVAKSILEAEKEFIKNINPEELESYAKNGTKDNGVIMKMNLITILLDLNDELTLIKNMSKDNNAEEYKVNLLKLEKIISDYYKCKNPSKIEEVAVTKEVEEPKTGPKIIFLTNSSDVPLINRELNKVDFKDLKKLNKAIFENMQRGNISSPDKIESYPNTYYSYFQPLRLSYVVLPNNGYLILTVVFHDGNIGAKTSKIMDQYNKDINDIISKSKDPKYLKALYESQKDIRASLSASLTKKKLIKL